jgi:hypothetical protein
MLQWAMILGAAAAARAATVEQQEKIRAALQDVANIKSDQYGG